MGDPLEQTLLAANREALDCGSVTPLLKKELWLKIQARRLSEGKEEMVIPQLPTPSYQMSQAEKAKKMRRKEQNRRAARKFRVKQKHKYLDVLERIEALEDSRQQLEEERMSLIQEKNDLLEQMCHHLHHCPNPPHLPTPPPLLSPDHNLHRCTNPSSLPLSPSPPDHASSPSPLSLCHQLPSLGDLVAASPAASEACSNPRGFAELPTGSAGNVSQKTAAEDLKDVPYNLSRTDLDVRTLGLDCGSFALESRSEVFAEPGHTTDLDSCETGTKGGTDVLKSQNAVSLNCQGKPSSHSDIHALDVERQGFCSVAKECQTKLTDPIHAAHHSTDIIGGDFQDSAAKGDHSALSSSVCSKSDMSVSNKRAVVDRNYGSFVSKTETNFLAPGFTHTVITEPSRGSMAVSFKEDGIPGNDNKANYEDGVNNKLQPRNNYDEDARDSADTQTAEKATTGSEGTISGPGPGPGDSRDCGFECGVMFLKIVDGKVEVVRGHSPLKKTPSTSRASVAPPHVTSSNQSPSDKAPSREPAPRPGSSTEVCSSPSRASLGEEGPSCSRHNTGAPEVRTSKLYLLNTSVGGFPLFILRESLITAEGGEEGRGRMQNAESETSVQSLGTSASDSLTPTGRRPVKKKSARPRAVDTDRARLGKKRKWSNTGTGTQALKSASTRAQPSPAASNTFAPCRGGKRKKTSETVTRTSFEAVLDNNTTRLLAEGSFAVHEDGTGTVGASDDQGLRRAGMSAEASAHGPTRGTSLRDHTNIRLNQAASSNTTTTSSNPKTGTTSTAKTKDDKRGVRLFHYCQHLDNTEPVPALSDQMSSWNGMNRLPVAAASESTSRLFGGGDPAAAASLQQDPVTNTDSPSQGRQDKATSLSECPNVSGETPALFCQSSASGRGDSSSPTTFYDSDLQGFLASCFHSLDKEKSQEDAGSRPPQGMIVLTSLSTRGQSGRERRDGAGDDGVVDVMDVMEVSLPSVDTLWLMRMLQGEGGAHHGTVLNPRGTGDVGPASVSASSAASLFSGLKSLLLDADLAGNIAGRGASPPGPLSPDPCLVQAAWAEGTVDPGQPTTTTTTTAQPSTGALSGVQHCSLTPQSPHVQGRVIISPLSGREEDCSTQHGGDTGRGNSGSHDGGVTKILDISKRNTTATSNKTAASATAAEREKEADTEELSMDNNKRATELEGDWFRPLGVSPGPPVPPGQGTGSRVSSARVVQLQIGIHDAAAVTSSQRLSSLSSLPLEVGLGEYGRLVDCLLSSLASAASDGQGLV